MKGIYLFACKARHENYDLDYNDKEVTYEEWRETLVEVEE